MTRKISSLLLCFYLIIPRSSMAQGCSDAGVCSIPTIRDNTAPVLKDHAKNSLLLSAGWGIGEKSTTQYITYIGYSREISRSFILSGKISYAAVKGKLASTHGFGDFYLTGAHRFQEKGNWVFSAEGGLKIPFNRSTLSSGGKSLPMPYQASLGTTDLLLGFSAQHRSLGLSLALQQPLKAENSNRFIPEEPEEAGYSPTNAFRRKADLVSRVAWMIPAGKHFSVRPSLLAIYHLGNDSYENDMKERMPLTGSQGLTLNINLFLRYRISMRHALEFSLGAPVLARDSRPDGLTREAAAALEYRFAF